MRSLSNLLAAAVLALLAGCSSQPPSPVSMSPLTPGPLFDTLAALDTQTFAAFTTCAQPGQLQKCADFFAETGEFHHDTGGATWNRKKMLANTEKYVCGNFRRELVPGSLRVYPIKDFGAISQGVHRFCQFKSGVCEGVADFMMLWRQEGGRWTITRVMSYGHRPV